MKPFISIVIPVYNGADFLRKAIESALAQTYDNYEVIVVNDGSNDEGRTEQIAQSYGSKIRYFKKENGGVATALNLALREMRGEYFSWLSHDDFYYPQKLERQMDALEKCGDMTRILISDYDRYDNERKNFSHFHMESMYPRPVIENSVFSILQGLVGGCSMLIHKSHFDRVGGFDEKLRTTQDYDLWFRMFRGQRLLYLPECVMAVRGHPRQGTHTIPTFRREQEALYIRFVKELSEREIMDMYGSKNIFYTQLLSMLSRWGAMGAYRFVNDLFQKEAVPEDLLVKLHGFYDFIAGLSGGKAKYICIFCAGRWGIHLYHELTGRLVRVDFFCDNDARKVGYVLENTWCVPLEKLQDVKGETLVIVSTVKPDPILQQLKELSFPFVATKQDFSEQLFSVPRIKWMTAMDSLKDVDYDSPQTEALIAQFKRTIFDICTYYENR